MDLDIIEIKEKLLELSKEVKNKTIDEITSIYYPLYDSLEESNNENEMRYLQIDFDDFIAYVDVCPDNTVELHFDAVQVFDEDIMQYKQLYLEKELRKYA